MVMGAACHELFLKVSNGHNRSAGGWKLFHRKGTEKVKVLESEFVPRCDKEPEERREHRPALLFLVVKTSCQNCRILQIHDQLRTTM